MKKMLMLTLLIALSKSFVLLKDIISTKIVDNYPNERYWAAEKLETTDIISPINLLAYLRPTKHNQMVKDTSKLVTKEDLFAKAFEDNPNKISGYVYYPNFSSNVCTPTTTGLGVENVKITLTTLSNSQSSSDYTNSSGFFEIDEPTSSGLIKLEAAVIDNKTGYDAKRYGISTFDIITIERHIKELNLFNCPIKRLAADFNIDGKIDTADTESIRRLVMSINHTYPIEPWRFIPNLTTYPSIQHPDMSFTGDYWNNDLPGQSGKHYPFDAKLNLLSQEYNYIANPNTWMEEVNEWQFNVGGACTSLDYGFWLIKLGDVNGSIGTFDFAPPVSSATSGALMSAVSPNDQGFQLVDPQIIPQPSNPQQDQGLSLRSNGKKKNYLLKVSVRSKLPLDAYQIGLKLDPSFFKVKKIAPKNNQKLRQKLKRNFNDNPEELNQGNIRTLFIGEFEKNKRKSIDIEDWTELINLEVELQNNSIRAKEALEKINFDKFLMPTEFISRARLINKEVEVRVDLVEI